MSFPEASFDGAWSACSLGHSPKIIFPDVLAKIHLLLKEEGYFYLALKKGSGESWRKICATKEILRNFGHIMGKKS